MQAKSTQNGVIRWTLVDKDSSEFEYNWEILYRPRLLKLLAIVALAFSIFSFLGVVCSMNGVTNQASVYFLAVHTTNIQGGGIVVFILVTLGYTTYITFWSLFQMRIAGMMELVPFRTTPESLSFNVRMIARLAAPLAFFYLGWIAENGVKQGSWMESSSPTIVTVTPNFVHFNSTNSVLPSSFSNFYSLSNLDVVKNIFGTFFPILLYVLLFLFITNIFNRYS